MAELEQTYTIKAPVSKVWQALTDADVDEQRDIADWRDYYFDPIKKLLEEAR